MKKVIESAVWKANIADLKAPNLSSGNNGFDYILWECILWDLLSRNVSNFDLVPPWIFIETPVYKR